jgi:hypothetical protein
VSSKRNRRQKKGIYLNGETEEVQMALQLSNNLRDRSKERDRKSQTIMGPTTAQLGQSYYGGHTVWQSCSIEHKGQALALTVQGKLIYGASAHGLDEYSGLWQLIIDLNDNVRAWEPPKPPMPPLPLQRDITSDRFTKLVENYTAKPKPWVPPAPPSTPLPEVLSLRWPDMGVISFPLSFWQQVLKMMPEKTCVTCLGGHGRTGTVMVALAIAGGQSYYDALKAVREAYCYKAVESLSQVQYLHGLWQAHCKQQVEAGKTEFAEQLNYAIQHPPNSMSDYGEEDKSPRKDATTAITTPSTLKKDEAVGTMEVGHALMFDRRFRFKPGGVAEQLVCTDILCMAIPCYNSQHFEWIAWEYEDELVEVG